MTPILSKKAMALDVSARLGHDNSATRVCLLLASLCAACGPAAPTGSNLTVPGDDQVLLVAMAEFGRHDDGSPKPLPAKLGIVAPDGDTWSYRSLEDADSNVMHKALAYRDGETGGLLTLGGTAATVKLWAPDGERTTIWEADFGGAFSRMRDAEVGDIYGDGRPAVAVVTHDQGVVAVLRPDAAGGFAVEEIDAQPETIVHEVELGDLDGDGTLEIYATPSEPNLMDGSEQPGNVVRYVPATGEGRVVVADLGTRHAKEILTADIDGDGRDELYVSVEAVSGGKVEIRRYLADSPPDSVDVVATLNDQLCRFLTVGDVDGDGQREMVAATYRRGVWLLRPQDGDWAAEQIAEASSSFEHASVLLDLDGDGRDELYVASDNQHELRRYDWGADGWSHDVLVEHPSTTPRLTWNLTAAPRALVPD